MQQVFLSTRHKQPELDTYALAKYIHKGRHYICKLNLVHVKGNFIMILKHFGIPGKNFKLHKILRSKRLANEDSERRKEKEKKSCFIALIAISK